LSLWQPAQYRSMTARVEAAGCAFACGHITAAAEPANSQPTVQAHRHLLIAPP
jgi:hypothetical protein